MLKTPHKEKLLKAIDNQKCKDDIDILREAENAYNKWISKLNSLTSSGKDRVLELRLA
jgi:hypothetical protein